MTQDNGPQVTPAPSERERSKVPHFYADDDDLTTRKFIQSMMMNHLPHIYSRMGTIEGKLTIILGGLGMVFSGMVGLIIKTFFIG